MESASLGLSSMALLQSLEALFNQRPVLLGESGAEFLRDHRQLIRMGGILGLVDVMILPHRLRVGESRRPNPARQSSSRAPDCWVQA